MFRITQGHPRLHPVFAYRPFTFYGVAFQPLRLTFRIPHRSPTTPGAKPLVWADPLSLATTNGISIDFFSSGYLDVSVLQVVSLNLCIQFKVPHKVVGFPIRKFSDQNLHTAPRNLSQYITSFIGFQCQGIRHTPLNA